MRTIPNLPAAIALQAYADLCRTLPLPPADTPEARAAREAEAWDALAELRPVTAFEARLAVDIIAADAHAKECLRRAAQLFNDDTVAPRCRAQFALMMRQVQSVLRTLQHIQGERLSAEAATTPAPEDSRPTPPSFRRPEETGQTQPTPPSPAPHPDPLAEAEDYALRNPVLAAHIRAAGGLTPALMADLDPAIAPPSPAIVATLVSGTSRTLCALDQTGRDVPQAA